MAQIVDLQETEDPRDAVHLAVQALSEGRLVGLPTESSYVLVGQVTHPQAMEQLARILPRDADPQGESVRPVLALKCAGEAADFVGDLTGVAERLARRGWPGPLTLRFGTFPADSLLSPLPMATQQLLLGASRMLSLRVVAHDLVTHLMRLMPAPLVLAPETNAQGAVCGTAAALRDRWGAEVSLVLDAGPTRFDQPATVVDLDGDRWQVVLEGVFSTRKLARMAGSVILFVCTGNTCRSPMAESLFRHMLADRLQCSEDELLDKGYTISSAGLAASPGNTASPEAVELLAARQIDLRHHASQQVTARLLQQADYIFTMTRGHRDAILRSMPQLADRVELLSSTGDDISDPIGCGPDEYARCLAEIESHLKTILDRLPLPKSPESPRSAD